MNIEERRRHCLQNLEVFKKRPDFLELYFYHLFEDDSFLTKDLLRENGKPSKPAINRKTGELVLLLAHIILESKGE